MFYPVGQSPIGVVVSILEDNSVAEMGSSIERDIIHSLFTYIENKLNLFSTLI